ncbi:MAG: DNA polymerase III subunit gamma/tau [Thermodesulfobacteriota bacterium]|jgi:DNA polymerase-3 subunit gamma/tau|nr:DNA polymerase III subunit gamma/tau [Candidatus Dadabacteria bacterium]|tara:strand:- start:5586 stop:7136 length:1551 start_codon:yes stop_codon:yes gene_type:complete
MSHIVLARKYRPKSFEEVIGQDNSVLILQSFISNNSIPHSLIFCGGRGVGKTSMARIFAKAINSDEISKNPLLAEDIDNGKSLDVIEIDAASNNGVDQIRELIESSQYSSLSCKYKVFIIDEVHMLSKAAFNALLKTLEEPKPNVIFILATTEVEKIPITIKSRSQLINFTNIDNNFLKELIQSISKEEKISIDEESIDLICSEANGSARDCLSILELLASSLNKKINYLDSSEKLGLTPNKIINEIAHKILLSDASSTIKVFNDIYNNGYNIKKFIQSLLFFYEKLIYLKLGLENDSENNIAISENKKDDFNSFSLAELETIFDNLIEIYNKVSKSDYEKMVAESGLIKLCLISNYINLVNLNNLGEEDLLKKKVKSPIKREKITSKEGEEHEIKTISSESVKDLFKHEKDSSLKLIKDADIRLDNGLISIELDSDVKYQVLKDKNKEIGEKINKEFSMNKRVELVMKEKEICDNNDGDNFNFSKNKDKLFESNSIKNLFETFDCRIIDIEKENK